MRIYKLFFVTVLIVSLVTGVFIGIYNVLAERDLFEDQAYRQLVSVADSKAERVKDFFDHRKKDVVFLAESDDVKNIFDKKLIFDVRLMEEKIKSISKQTAGDIEDYMHKYPNSTLKDLQDDEMFWNIAVRDVGETGYTYVNSMGSGVLYFHPDPGARGKTYHAWEERFPFIWELNNKIATSSPCMDSFGFYDWEDINGNVRKKFTYHSCIDAETSDGYSFYVGASTYIDEYSGSVELAHDIDLDMKLFQKNKGYENLIFINSRGDVIWMAETGNELGTNLITGIYNESLLANVFNKVRNNLNVSVSDSEVYGVEGNLNIFITAPVTNDTGGFLGIVALQVSNDKISELVITDVGLGSAGEVYIVNRRWNHITPLKFDEAIKMKGFYHIVNSVGVEDCLRDYENYYLALAGKDVYDIEKTGIYSNYAGDSVLGTHIYIPELGWCMIVEMSEDDFLESIAYADKVLIITIFLVICFVLLLSFVLESIYDVRKERGS